jgi:fumarylacetoacetate (FAA) hydrolase family protein
MQELSFSAAEMPAGEWRRGLYVGRIETSAGPSPIVIRNGILHDMARVAPTTADLIRLRAWSDESGQALGQLEDVITGLPGAPTLLSPLDLQCVKAAGVTFAVSAIERVIEERARGDANAAAAVRGRLEARIGGSIRSVSPGSDEAAALKATLIEEGMWSQYLEVAIGPDAEVFTKAPILSTMGWGAEIGVRSDSSWNNPEPEIVIVADRDGVPVGATLGNDVNLRDFEGRSALLLGKAKDNNASCSIGPFVRIFDESFTMDDVRSARVDLSIEGVDGYRLTGASSMAEISRDPTDLVAQTMSEHQYPDGFALFLGTLFAPIEDRDEPGRGFTHKMGDVVSISTPHLGRLVNRVTSSKAAAPWAFGVGDLMRNLAGRQLLAPAGGR